MRAVKYGNEKFLHLARPVTIERPDNASGFLYRICCITWTVGHLI